MNQYKVVTKDGSARLVAADSFSMGGDMFSTKHRYADELARYHALEVPELIAVIQDVLSVEKVNE